MILCLAIGCAVLGVVVTACSRSARSHLHNAWRTLKDDETRHTERVLIVAGVLLIASGALIPGPLDEILGALLIARIVRRVTQRKEGERC
jgi:UPF0716 family protein affecting phage T7 exclusion